MSSDLEKRARELLAELARQFGQPEYAYHIGCGSPLDNGDKKLIAPIISALTPDKTMVEMPGLGFSMPRWVLQYALEIGAYMDERHPGNWKLGPIQKRDAAALTPPEGYVLVPIDPDCTELPNYIAGRWSRRNWEAALEDLTAARPEVP